MSEPPSPELFSQSEPDEEKCILELPKENKQSTSASTKKSKKDKSAKSTRLPLARVKAIMKIDPDVRLISQESVLLVARATEMFLKQLAKETYVHTSKEKRKTVQKKDINAAIKLNNALDFLDGNLE